MPRFRDGARGGLGSDPVAAETRCVTLRRWLPFFGLCVLFGDSGIGRLSLDHSSAAREVGRGVAAG